MTRHLICNSADLADGAIVRKAGRVTLVVVQLPSGKVSAVAARCPHQGADLTHACITGYVCGDRPNELHVERQGEILRCPWHGFEFDLVDGKSVADKGKMKLRQFAVEVENGDVYVSV
jgi:nitrite reductase/ring-hydroxylating ferredoxin subunit